MKLVPKRAVAGVRHGLIFTAKHARGALAPARSPVPWPHMFICGAATALPVLAGLLRGEVALAIYGALAGYLITLNDHFGALRHRLLITALSFASLAVAFSTGYHLHGHPLLFISVITALTYWLGLMGGTGAEVERLLLFSVMAIVIVYYAPAGTAAAGRGVLNYGLFALAIICAGQCASDRFAARHRVKSFARLRPSLKGALTTESARHRYALNYLMATGLAINVVDHFAIERGYWTVITVLLVMRPDFKDSAYRHLQRLFGTLLGVTVGDVLVLIVNIKALLVLGVAVAAFAVPYGLKRNYWLVSFFATILVVLFLTLPTVGISHDTHVPFVRLRATVYGCALSGAVTLISLATSHARSARAVLAQMGVLGLMFGVARADAAEFDVYRPAKTKAPLVIFVHGGAWIGGARGQYAELGRALAARGWCAAIIDYRLAPGTRHPGPVEDLEAARAALVKSPGRGCDATRVVMVGHSAGAHAIAFWATRYAAPVRALVGLEGIFDLPKLAARFPDYADWFLTKAFGPAADWANASPARLNAKAKIPWLLVHSPADELVDPLQTEAFAAHLKSRPERFAPPGLSHFQVVDEWLKPDSALSQKISRFISAHAEP